MLVLRLALRMLARDARAGELGLLAVAMTIAIAGMTTVNFFTERVQRALDVQASKLIGADLTVASDRAMPASYEDEAHALGLTTAHAMDFPSMVTGNEHSTLTEIRVVNAGYPVRGELQIADAVAQPSHVAQGIPNAGLVWIDARLASQLGLNTGSPASSPRNAGSIIQVGNAHLKVAAILTQEPGGLAGFGFFNALPHLLMNEADIAATGLIQPGSRIRYRLYIAGQSAAVSAYRAWLQAHIASWENIERSNGKNEANDPARGLLNRAAQYLSLAALLGVIIAAVAIALAARRFVARHLDACAIMRCLGARQSTILQLYALHFLVFGLIAGISGCAIGYAAQFMLAHSLNSFMHLTLPNAGIRPIWNGMLVGLVLLAGFAVPPLVALARVPTLRVLRRDMATQTIGGFAYAFGILAIILLVLWQAHDMRLGLYVIGGVIATALILGASAAGILRLLARLKFNHVGWRYGVMHMQRRAWTSVVQIVALGVGFMAILTLALIRGDLLENWNASLGSDTPNRFIINIQPDQLQPVADFFKAAGIAVPAFYPMVRGRLVAVNDREISSRDYADGRAQRLLDREFNLSWMSAFPAGSNTLVAGKWWTEAANARQPNQLSVEQGIAQTLHFKLGDVLTYDVAGTRFSATMTSLRQVKWDSFQVNFFVITPPALLRDYPASWITSLHVSPTEAPAFNKIAGRGNFANIVVIDVSQILEQLQNMVKQIAGAVQFLFLFVLAAGIAVLWAVIASTADARLYEAAVMRALGASRRQILQIQATEFLLTGALAGILAAAGASALASVLADKLLDMPYYGAWWIWLIAMIGGALSVMLVGYAGIRRILNTPLLPALH